MKKLIILLFILFASTHTVYGQVAANADSMYSALNQNSNYIEPVQPQLSAGIESMDPPEETYSVRNLPSGPKLFPYGHSSVTLRAKPLYISIVKLQPGERLLSLSAGDTRRWRIRKAYTVVNGQTTPLIQIKPIKYGISTNMVITTDRRVYQIRLKSVQRGENDFDQQIAFYYPDMNQPIETIGIKPNFGADEENPYDPEKGEIFTRYKTVEGDEGFPWEPVSIWDDGNHVYIEIPKGVEAQELPAFYVVNNVGENILINTAYNPETRIITTDRLFEVGVLLYRSKEEGFLGIGTDHIKKQLFIIRNPVE